MRFASAVLLLPFFAWTGCVVNVEDPPEPAPTVQELLERRLEDLVGASQCEQRPAYDSPPLADSKAVADCSISIGGGEPPSSGDYFESAVEYGPYTEAVNRGFLLHSLRKGGVAITYSCSDQACQDEIEEAGHLIGPEGFGIDPLCCAHYPGACSGPGVSRLILSPDPLLDRRWAASAWGHTLTADCFEPELFAAFIDAWRGVGGEPDCEDGSSSDVVCSAP